MKVKFLAGQWQGSLKGLSNIASANKTQKAWQMILVNPKSKMITASNERITVMSRVEMESDSEQPFLIDSSRFASVVSVLSPDSKVELDVADNKVNYKSGRSRFNLQTLPESEFARIDKPKDMSNFLVDSAQFKRAIDNTLAFVAGAGESREMFKGIHFVCDEQNSISMTATNGHFLSHVKFTGAEVNKHESGAGLNVILSPEFMRHAQRMATESPKLMLYIADNKACISTPNQMVWANVLEGKYPNIESLLKVSNRTNAFKPDVASWQSSITRIKPLVDSAKSLGRISLTNDAGSMKMSVSNELGDSDEYVDGIDVSFKDEVHLSLNYLDTVLKNHSEVEVVLPEDGMTHAHFIGGSDGLVSHQLISPMRI